MTIHVEIVSQEKLVFVETEADMVIIPAVEGEMGVLPHHAPVLTTMGFGELIVRKGNAEESFAIFGGVVDVRPNKVVVLAEMAESSYELNAEAAEAARARAEKMLAEGLPAGQQHDATLALRRANLELKLSRKMKSAHTMRIIVDEADNS